MALSVLGAHGSLRKHPYAPGKPAAPATRWANGAKRGKAVTCHVNGVGGGAGGPSTPTQGQCMEPGPIKGIYVP